MNERAEIIDTGIPLYFKSQLLINAPAKKIFDFISKPKNHSLMDGSGMVKNNLSGPEQLFLGAKFGMRMRLGLSLIHI